MSAPFGVDMTYLVTRAFSGPHDVDRAVHAFSMSEAIIVCLSYPDKSESALKRNIANGK